MTSLISVYALNFIVSLLNTTMAIPGTQTNRLISGKSRPDYMVGTVMPRKWVDQSDHFILPCHVMVTQVSLEN